MISNSRKIRYRLKKPMSNINVTPLVDVMLVLLIVFMITAPMLTVGVQVDLPQTKANQLNSDADPLIITMNKNREIFIQDAVVSPEDLIPRLKAISKVNSKTRIFVRGDNLLPYGEVIEIMGKIQSAGYEKVALVAKLPDDS
ncbi:MAG: ExbD/TolR family protein [Candidatus Puniceispirillales bacterium]